MEEQSSQMDSIDRVSAMPFDILHSILCLLPPTDAVKFSVLSKRWLSVWDSYPVFDFLPEYGTFSRCQSIYSANRYNYMVDRRLGKFCKLGFSIQKVKFDISEVNHEFDHLFKKWMALITEKKVKELDFCISYSVQDCYSIPQTVFAAKSLTVLKICGSNRLEIDDDVRSSMNLQSLQTLSLDQVKVSDMTIQLLMRSCPSLEDLSLLSCSGFKELNLSGMVNLVNLTVRDYSCLVRLSNCQVLKRVSLDYVSLDCVFDDHNFPQIEFISLVVCTFSRGIRIFSHQLKTLVLEFQNLDNLEIFAPNLRSIQQVDRCYADNSAAIESKGHLITSILKPNVHYALKIMVDFGGECDGTPWFIKFKDFLQLRTTMRTLEMHILFKEITKFNKEEALHCSPSPPSTLEHLILEVENVLDETSELDMATLLDGFLWCCHPDVLSFPLDPFHAQFPKFLCQTLEEDHVCCSSSEIKCWRHSLKKVKDVTVEDMNGIKQKVPFSWEHLSKAISEKGRVSFDLTW